MQSSRQEDEDFCVEDIKNQIREDNASTLDRLERCRRHAASTLATSEAVRLRLQSQGQSIERSRAHLIEAGVQTQLASDNIEELQSLTGKAGTFGPSISKKRKDDCNHRDAEPELRDVQATSADNSASNKICHSWNSTHAAGLKYQFEATEEDMQMETKINARM